MKNFNRSSVTTLLIAQSDSKIAIDIKEALSCNFTVRVVGIVNTGKELLSWLSHSIADIILCDLYLSSLDGVLLMQLASSYSKSSKFIFYVDLEHQWMISKAIKKGARGFLSKQSDINLVNNAIEVINNGGTYLDDLSIYQILNQGEYEYHISENT